MGSEGGLYENIAPKLRPYGRFERVENSISSGWPDLYYLVRGHSGWIELKYLPRWPKLATTLVRIPSLTREQTHWLGKEAQNGGRAYLLLQVERDYHLFDGALVGRLFLDFPRRRPELLSAAALIMKGSFSAVNFLKIIT